LGLNNNKIHIDQIANSFILCGQVRESSTILKIKRGEGDSGLQLYA